MEKIGRFNFNTGWLTISSSPPTISEIKGCKTFEALFTENLISLISSRTKEREKRRKQKSILDGISEDGVELEKEFLERQEAYNETISYIKEKLERKDKMKEMRIQRKQERESVSQQNQKRKEENKNKIKPSKKLLSPVLSSSSILTSATEESMTIAKVEELKIQDQMRLDREREQKEKLSLWRSSVLKGKEEESGGKDLKTRRKREKKKTKKHYETLFSSSSSSSSFPVPLSIPLQSWSQNENESIFLEEQEFFCVQRKPFVLWAGLKNHLLEDKHIQSIYEGVLKNPACRIFTGDFQKKGVAGIKKLSRLIHRDIYELCIPTRDDRPIAKLFYVDGEGKCPLWFREEFSFKSENPSDFLRRFQSTYVLYFYYNFKHREIEKLDGILTKRKYKQLL